MKNNEKYGFVYIWYDSGRNRFYIGSHWGHVDDGYICSSNSMRDAYRRRPNDFKRKILCYVYTDRKGLLEEEQRYLDKIDRKHFGRKYYNVNASVNQYYWWINEETTKIVKENIKKGLRKKEKEDPTYLERRNKLSREGRINSMKNNPEKWKSFYQENSKRTKELWKDSEYIQKQKDKGWYPNRLRDASLSEEGLEKRRRIASDPAFIEKMKQIVNQPDRKEMSSKVWKGKKVPDELKIRRIESGRKTYEKKYKQNCAHISIEEFKIAYENVKYNIAELIKIFNVDRNNIKWFMKEHNIEFKKYKNPKGRVTRGSKGMKWWNNGKEEVLSLECPHNWVKGRIKNNINTPISKGV